MNSGAAPTDLKARTGLSTPPGRRARACLNSERDRLIFMWRQSRSVGVLYGTCSRRMSIANRTTLGPYEIVATLGAGGMGEVYRAHDRRLGRDVAVKVLPSAYSADPDRLRRFEQDAHAAA